MNKKLSGMKIGTILTAIACVALSVLIWILIEYNA